MEPKDRVLPGQANGIMPSLWPLLLTELDRVSENPGRTIQSLPLRKVRSGRPVSSPEGSSGSRRTPTGAEREGCCLTDQAVGLLTVEEAALCLLQLAEETRIHLLPASLVSLEVQVGKQGAASDQAREEGRRPREQFRGLPGLAGLLPVLHLGPPLRTGELPHST